MIYDGYGNRLGNRNAWCGETPNWVKSVVALDAYAGQTVQFRYRLGTDSSNLEDVEGWYLDAVSVQSCEFSVRFYFPLINRK